MIIINNLCSGDSPVCKCIAFLLMIRKSNDVNDFNVTLLMLNSSLLLTLCSLSNIMCNVVIGKFALLCDHISCNGAYNAIIHVLELKGECHIHPFMSKFLEMNDLCYDLIA